MLGAIVGDIVGSIYEWNNIKTTDFPLFSTRSHFTDDTVLTLAVAKWLMEDPTHSQEGLVRCLQELGRKCPRAGYGGRFRKWLASDTPQTLSQLREWFGDENYCFDETCLGSVPIAIMAFIEAGSFEETIRLAVSMGGDSDTIACMAGSIASAGYGEEYAISPEIEKACMERLTPELQKILQEFEAFLQSS